MPSRGRDDDQLTAALNSGEPGALRATFDRFGRLIHSFCRRALAEREAATATEQTFVTAWLSRDELSPAPPSLAAWLMGIASREVSGARHRPIGAEVAVDELAARLLVADALEQLPDGTRTYLHMAYSEGLDVERIAERTVCEPADVREMLEVGLARVRQHLSADAPTESPDAAPDHEHEIDLLQSLARRPVIVHPPPANLWSRIEASLDARDTATLQRKRAHARRRNHRRWFTVGAALVLIAGAAAAVAYLVTRDDGPSPVLATATLQPYRGMDLGQARVSAVLERDGAGLLLRMRVSEMPRAETGSHYEVWLLDGGDIETGTPIGRIDESDVDLERTFDVPTDLARDRFDTVDISIQGDGDTAHSGNSILRGKLG